MVHNSCQNCNAREVNGTKFKSAEKAFDGVNWSYIRAVLEYIGIGEGMPSIILSLYSNPSATVCVNGTSSSSFDSSHGTRQGCLLSPLIFTLVLEPFLCRVRNNLNVEGVRVGGINHKVAAYADDLLFFISKPLTSLPCLLQEIKSFGKYSYYKINWAKSEALYINMEDSDLEHLKSNFPFKWVQGALRYLGTWILANIENIFEYNFPPLLKKLPVDLKRWSTGP